MVRIRLLIALALCLPACIMMLLHLLCCVIAGHTRGFVVAFGLDQAANGSLGGDPDETLCSRAWRLQLYSRRWNMLRHFFDWLFSPVEADHCHNVYMRELAARERWNNKQG